VSIGARSRDPNRDLLRGRRFRNIASNSIDFAGTVEGDRGTRGGRCWAAATPGGPAMRMRVELTLMPQDSRRGTLRQCSVQVADNPTSHSGTRGSIAGSGKQSAVSGQTSIDKSLIRLAVGPEFAQEDNKLPGSSTEAWKAETGRFSRKGAKKNPGRDARGWSLPRQHHPSRLRDTAHLEPQHKRALRGQAPGGRQCQTVRAGHKSLRHRPYLPAAKVVERERCHRT